MSDEMTAPIRVLHVEDHLWVAEAWARVLSEHGFVTVAIAGSVTQAESLISSTSFDLALVDLELAPREGGGEKVLALLRSRKPDVLTAVITGHVEAGDAVLHRAMAQHPNGWISKKTPAHEAITALREVVKGGPHGWYASPDLRPAVGNRRLFSAYEAMNEEQRRFFLLFAADGDQQKVFCERFHYTTATFNRRINQIKMLVIREMDQLGLARNDEARLTNEQLLRWARDHFYHYR